MDLFDGEMIFVQFRRLLLAWLGLLGLQTRLHTEFAGVYKAI